MLSNATVGNGISSAKLPAMMASDRGDPWAGTRETTTLAGLGRIDLASMADGLVADTLIATEHGWTQARDLRPGDMVVTFDNGLQPLRSVQCATLWTAESGAPRQSWPLTIPARVLGNRTDMRLMPNQEILLETHSAASHDADAFMLVTAACLDGYMGIARTPPAREMALYTLGFDADEVIYTNGTLLVHCAANPLVSQTAQRAGVTTPSPYRRLTDAQGLGVVQGMMGVA